MKSYLCAMWSLLIFKSRLLVPSLILPNAPCEYIVKAIFSVGKIKSGRLVELTAGLGGFSMNSYSCIHIAGIKLLPEVKSRLGLI